MAVEYTETLIREYHTFVDTESVSIPRDGIDSDFFDLNTYYILVTFRNTGTVKLYFTGFIRDTSAPIIGAKLTENRDGIFNTETGWPNDEDVIVSGTVFGISEAIPKQAFEFVVDTQKTYRIYFRNTNTNPGHLIIQPRIQFNQSDGPFWSDTRINLKTVTETSTVNIYEPEQYKYYCYQLKFAESGVARIERILGEDQTAVYVTDEYNYSIYSKTTGVFDTEELISPDAYVVYAGNLEISVRSGVTLYIWIKHIPGTDTTPVQFRIYPPGSAWYTERFKSNTMVTRDGVSWTVGGRTIGTKMVEYVPLGFNPSGKYKFNMTVAGTDKYRAYLTSSTDIDSNGVPTSIIKSGTSGQIGFDLEETVYGGESYYLMFRTDSGDPNTDDGIITISFVEGIDSSNWYCYSETIDDGHPRPTQFKKYYTYDQHILHRVVMSFTKSGTVKFYSSAPTIQDTCSPRGWIASHVDAYNSTEGTPSSSAHIYAHDEGYENPSDQFYIEVSVQQGVLYDFWFRLQYETQTGYGYISIDPPGWSEVDWQCYDRTWITDLLDLPAGVVTKECRFDQPLYNAKYKISFLSSGVITIGSSGSIAVSGFIGDTDNGFHEYDGEPLDSDASAVGNNNFVFTFTVTAGTIYYLWIKGNDATVSGTTNFSIAAPDSWSYTDEERVDVADTSSVPLTLAKSVGFCIPIQFSTPGTAEITMSDSVEIIGYFASSKGSYSTADGVPATYQITDYSESGKVLQIISRVANAAPYYLWVRGKTAITDGSITLSIVLTSSNEGYCWIFTDSGWKRAKPYIYTGTTGGWKPATPWIFTSSGWKKCN